MSQTSNTPPPLRIANTSTYISGVDKRKYNGGHLVTGLIILQTTTSGYQKDSLEYTG
jgi:hypothetical protein